MTFTSIEASQGDLDRKDGGLLGRGRTIVEAACSAKSNDDGDQNYRPGYDDQYQDQEKNERYYENQSKSSLFN